MYLRKPLRAICSNHRPFESRVNKDDPKEGEGGSISDRGVGGIAGGRGSRGKDGGDWDRERKRMGVKREKGRVEVLVGGLVVDVPVVRDGILEKEKRCHDLIEV